jgi:hypothetical protein
MARTIPRIRRAQDEPAEPTLTVADWFYQRLTGQRPDITRPTYRDYLEAAEHAVNGNRKLTSWRQGGF